MPTTDISLAIAKPKFKTTWELIDLSIRLFIQSYSVNCLIVLCFKFPNYLITLLAPDHADPNIKALSTLLPLLLNPFQIAVWIYILAHYLKKQECPALGEAFTFGFKKWPSFFVYWLCTFLLTFIGFFFFIVPGVAASLAYFLVPYTVCLGSKKDNFLTQSRELTVGRRLRLIGMVFVSILVGIALMIVPCFLGFILSALPYAIPQHSWWPIPPFETRLFQVIVDFFADVSFGIIWITLLLVFLQWTKEKRKKPKELWFLRWAP